MLVRFILSTGLDCIALSSHDLLEGFYFTVAASVASHVCLVAPAPDDFIQVNQHAANGNLVLSKSLFRLKKERKEKKRKEEPIRTG